MFSIKTNYGRHGPMASSRPRSPAPDVVEVVEIPDEPLAPEPIFLGGEIPHPATGYSKVQQKQVKPGFWLAT